MPVTTGCEGGNQLEIVTVSAANALVAVVTASAVDARKLVNLLVCFSPIVGK